VGSLSGKRNKTLVTPLKQTIARLKCKILGKEEGWCGSFDTGEEVGGVLDCSLKRSWSKSDSLALWNLISFEENHRIQLTSSLHNRTNPSEKKLFYLPPKIAKKEKREQDKEEAKKELSFRGWKKLHFRPFNYQ
jgi:hypothetical protein